MEDKEIKNKKIANEILQIFEKFKLSIILSLLFFIGYSYYNKLIQISLFNYEFAWFEAQDIFEGYIPVQYVNIEDSAEYIEGTDLKTISHGHFEISDIDYIEVKKEIISKLLNDSFKFSFLALPIIFLVLIIFHYAFKSLKWVKKYSSESS